MAEPIRKPDLPDRLKPGDIVTHRLTDELLMVLEELPMKHRTYAGTTSTSYARWFRVRDTKLQIHEVRFEELAP